MPIILLFLYAICRLVLLKKQQSNKNEVHLSKEQKKQIPDQNYTLIDYLDNKKCEELQNTDIECKIEAKGTENNQNKSNFNKSIETENNSLENFNYEDLEKGIIISEILDKPVALRSKEF